MNLLSWMMPVFLLSAGTSLAAVDVNWLTRIVRAIKGEYDIKEQFCLAANIPLGQDPNRLLQVLQDDRYSGNVEGIVTGFRVYESSNVVAAKHVENQHAEPLVLKTLKKLIKNKAGKFLLIYSYLSPCGDKCTNPEKKCNILKCLEGQVIPNWTDYAFVFTKVFDQPKGSSEKIPKNQLKESLKRLGDSGIGLENIFRCYTSDSEFQCHSCSSNGRVSEVCVDNNFVPQQGGSSSREKPKYRSPSESSRRSRGGRSRSRNVG